jgi:hypothetical protein
MLQESKPDGATASNAEDTSAAAERAEQAKITAASIAAAVRASTGKSDGGVGATVDASSIQSNGNGDDNADSISYTSPTVAGESSSVANDVESKMRALREKMLRERNAPVQGGDGDRNGMEKRFERYVPSGKSEVKQGFERYRPRPPTQE